MSYIKENSPQEKLIKARILVSQVGCVTNFIDLDHLTIDNLRGVDLGLSESQLKGLFLLLDQVSEDLSDVKRLATESGLVLSEKLSEVNNYVDSAHAVLDVSRELFDLHWEQHKECAKKYLAPSDNVATEASAASTYVGGFFHGLNKVESLTIDCWTVLNEVYEQTAWREGGDIE